MFTTCRCCWQNDTSRPTCTLSCKNEDICTWWLPNVIISFEYDLFRCWPANTLTNIGLLAMPTQHWTNVNLTSGVYSTGQVRDLQCYNHTWFHMCLNVLFFNPLTAKLFNLNFHQPEVVSRWRDPQLQVSENYSDLTNWRLTLFKSCRLMSHFIFNIFKRWYLMC